MDIYQARRVQRIRAFLSPKKFYSRNLLRLLAPRTVVFGEICAITNTGRRQRSQKMPKYPDSPLSTTVQWSICRIYLHASQQLPTIPKHVFAVTEQDASHTASGRKEPSQSYRTLRCKGSAEVTRHTKLCHASSLLCSSVLVTCRCCTSKITIKSVPFEKHICTL